MSAPVVPNELMTYLHAYGDARADDDGTSGVRLAEAILAMRRWGQSIHRAALAGSAQPASDVAQAYREMKDAIDANQVGAAPPAPDAPVSGLESVPRDEVKADCCSGNYFDAGHDPDCHMAVPKGAAPTLPMPGSPEASAVIDTVLAEYNWPANSKNAARAGFEAARRLAAPTAAQPAPVEPQPEAPAALALADALERGPWRVTAVMLECAADMLREFAARAQAPQAQPSVAGMPKLTSEVVAAALTLRRFADENMLTGYWHIANIGDVGRLAQLAAPQAQAQEDKRACTCNPADNPPQPCEKQYALQECRAARAQAPTQQQEPPMADTNEAKALPQREFNDLLDHLYEYGTAAEGITGRALALCRAYAAQQAGTAPQAERPKPLDDPRLQEIFSCAIDGALTSGYQGVAPAPAGHWLEKWWLKGRAVAEAEQPKPTPQELLTCAALDWLERNLFERKWSGTIGEPYTWRIRGDYRHTMQHLRGDTLLGAITTQLVFGTDKPTTGGGND